MNDNDNVEEIILQNFTLILFDQIILYIINSKICSTFCINIVLERRTCVINIFKMCHFYH